VKLKIDLESGLHDKANQKRFSDPKLTAQISEFLLEENHLQRLCEVSRCKAPIRKSYLKELTRSQTVLPAHQEARLERAVWATWRPYFHKTRDRCVLPGDPFAEDISYIATYQLALFNAKEREGWGHVDLEPVINFCSLSFLKHLKNCLYIVFTSGH